MYVEHADALFSYFARRVGRDHAEDLLAETFQVALHSFESFDADRGSDRGWLFGIGSNLLRHHWRTEQRRLRALARDAETPATSIDPLLSVGDHVVDRVDAGRAVERVIDALGELDADDRTLLFLSGWEHMTSREIGTVIGAPAATASGAARMTGAVDGHRLQSPDGRALALASSPAVTNVQASPFLSAMTPGRSSAIALHP